MGALGSSRYSPFPFPDPPFSRGSPPSLYPRPPFPPAAPTRRGFPYTRCHWRHFCQRRRNLPQQQPTPGCRGRGRRPGRLPGALRPLPGHRAAGGHPWGSQRREHPPARFTAGRGRAERRRERGREALPPLYEEECPCARRWSGVSGAVPPPRHTHARFCRGCGSGSRRLLLPPSPPLNKGKRWLRRRSFGSNSRNSPARRSGSGRGEGGRESRQEAAEEGKKRKKKKKRRERGRGGRKGGGRGERGPTCSAGTRSVCLYECGGGGSVPPGRGAGGEAAGPPPGPPLGIWGGGGEDEASASPAAVSLPGEKQAPPSLPPSPPHARPRAPTGPPAASPPAAGGARGLLLRLGALTFVPLRPPARYSPGPRRGARKGTRRRLLSASGTPGPAQRCCSGSAGGGPARRAEGPIRPARPRRRWLHGSVPLPLPHRWLTDGRTGTATPPSPPPPLGRVSQGPPTPRRHWPSCRKYWHHSSPLLWKLRLGAECVHGERSSCSLLAAFPAGSASRLSGQQLPDCTAHGGRGTQEKAKEPRGRGLRLRGRRSVAHFPPRRRRWRPAGRKEGGGRRSALGSAAASAATPGAAAAQGRGSGCRQRRRQRWGEVSCLVSWLWVGGKHWGPGGGEREGAPLGEAGPSPAAGEQVLRPPRPAQEGLVGCPGRGRGKGGCRWCWAVPAIAGAGGVTDRALRGWGCAGLAAGGASRPFPGGWARQRRSENGGGRRAGGAMRPRLSIS